MAAARVKATDRAVRKVAAVDQTSARPAVVVAAGEDEWTDAVVAAPGGLGGPGGWESAEEREKFKLEVETFLKAHSPKRWEDFKAKNDRGQDHNRLVWSMAARYRGLQMLEKDDKPLYDIKVKQIEIEDTEFA